MPEPSQLAKAELREIRYGTSDPVQYGDLRMKVQFNPETLTVTFTNQIAGGDNNGRGAIQFAGRGSTKLALDLWFDASQPVPEGNDLPAQVDDVRKLTQKLAMFMNPAGRENRPRGKNQQATFTPPAVHFLWGTFLFQGVIDSLTEKMEHFSDDGKPLRAMVSVSLTSQEFQYNFNSAAASGDAASAASPAAAASAPGTQPQQVAQEGQTVQGMAAASGNRDWRQVAAANNIEDPLRLTPGQRINTNLR